LGNANGSSARFLFVNLSCCRSAIDVDW
jgi:hypothetical protein